ncbi:MAG TPA: tRNA (N6-isopentenyl adenosine(37)-C2)-methylthiotransferase MiaB [Lentisphaeria bacterium]|nr:MAG: tRNA (N6-isopentenyl adenosine(37)-C2)-methylthiotransferase MiaB [Lentisphaerae bacterium GWF2_50_93]HCE42323.1 tRNA (N6-isopentenyl adenosine(37)-C2)-methylthiotransferase MiaB [Lentisphaeria bacterium]
MKFYIRTYGCQMNERDSEAAASALIASGHEMVHDEKMADILLFNTCSVREHAERKALGKVGILIKLKKKKPDIIIGVLGCMAQRLKEKIIEDIPHVDFVAGTDQFHRLPEIVASIILKRKHVVAVDADSEIIENLSGHIHSDNQISAFVSVMRGCNRFCSYCIVPYVRGREKSRGRKEIIEEAKKLVGSGIREILLLGQNIAAYGLEGRGQATEESPFAELLEELCRIDGLLRIRFASPHPQYFNEKLIDAVATLPKICKNVHLPLQSGSDRILKLMNRHYTAEKYLSIVNDLRSKVPEITFSTDIIIGFPTETEEDFNASRTLMKAADFDNAYIFKYSTRSGTKAAEMKDDVPQPVKDERNQILLADLAEMTERHNKAIVGSTLEVLVEGVSKRNSERWCGRSDSNSVVVFDPVPGIKIGDLVKLKITRATTMTLFGE